MTTFWPWVISSIKPLRSASSACWVRKAVRLRSMMKRMLKSMRPTMSRTRRVREGLRISIITRVVRKVMAEVSRLTRVWSRAWLILSMSLVKVDISSPWLWESKKARGISCSWLKRSRRIRLVVYWATRAMSRVPK